MTREEAAEELSALLCRCGIYATSGVLVAAVDAHWTELARLAHAVHDDWQPEKTAYEAAAYEAAIAIANRRSVQP